MKDLSDLKDVHLKSDIVCLTEIWSSHANTILPLYMLNYELIYSDATREKTKGRLKEDLVIILNRDVYKHHVIERSSEKLILKISTQDLSFILILIYFNLLNNISEALENLSDSISGCLNEFSSLPIMATGDFNARIGELNSLDDYLSDGIANASAIRLSLDKEVDTRGKKLVDYFEKNGIVILNGRFPGDSPAQFTFHGQRGFTVIDVAACIWEHLDIIEDFEVRNLVTNSDHMPICIKFKNKTVCDLGLIILIVIAIL